MKQSTWWQYILPQHLLSTVAGKLASCKCKKLKNWAIKWFVRRYGVDLSEAKIEQPEGFADFNAFFTRHLKPGARPLVLGPRNIISPVDGKISEIGVMEKDQVFQAKGKSYSLSSLLGDATLAKKFNNGSFFTAYLSPRDYHRFHMPVKGRLREMHYIPGNLFSVNEASVAAIDRLFARNERVVAVFDSDIGPFAYIAVGAMIVGSIAMSWHGVVNPSHGGMIQTWNYQNNPVELDTGEECGFFQLGSTVILIFAEGALEWDHSLSAGADLKMGQLIAHTRSNR